MLRLTADVTEITIGKMASQLLRNPVSGRRFPVPATTTWDVSVGTGAAVPIPSLSDAVQPFERWWRIFPRAQDAATRPAERGSSRPVALGYAKRARPGSRDSHQCQISQVRQCDTETVPQGGPLWGYIAIGACFRTRISAIAGFCTEFAGFRT